MTQNKFVLQWLDEMKNLVNPDNNKKVSSKENVNKKIKVYKDEEGVLQYEMEELK